MMATDEAGRELEHGMSGSPGGEWQASVCLTIAGDANDEGSFDLGHVMTGTPDAILAGAAPGLPPLEVYWEDTGRRDHGWPVVKFTGSASVIELLTLRYAVMGHPGEQDIISELHEYLVPVSTDPDRAVWTTGIETAQELGRLARVPQTCPREGCDSDEFQVGYGAQPGEVWLTCLKCDLDIDARVSLK